MKGRKAYLGLVVTIISLILLHEPVLILLSNISTMMRVDNSKEVEEYMYEHRIEELERELLSYQDAYDNIKLYSSYGYIPAKTSMRSIYDFYDYIMINPNTKVSSGDVVINESGLVGIISEADNKTAKVSLITGKVKVSVKVASSYGILSEYDRQEKLLIIHNINNYEKIEEGDEVVTSGLSDIAGNIKVGKVLKVVAEGLEKTVYVRSDVDFDNLNYLYVIAK